MKNVRIWFRKEAECKYISHLDLNRCMTRAVRRAELPIWYTEGFNPHPFLTFPLPLSLGVSGVRECMDIRIIDDTYDISMIPGRMNSYLPHGLSVFAATYPELDPKYICFAKFSATISVDGMNGIDLHRKIESLKSLDSVVVQKKSKAGMKDVDVLPYIREFEFTGDSSEDCSFTVILPAGNTKNIGLQLILKAIEAQLGSEINSVIVKQDMFTEEMNQFA